MLEAVAENRDLARAAFALHAGAIRRPGLAVPDDAVDHDAPVAANDVDRGATTRAPTLDGATLIGKSRRPESLMPSWLPVVPTSRDEAAEHHVVRAGVALGEHTAVVDVQAVVGKFFENESVYLTCTGFERRRLVSAFEKTGGFCGSAAAITMGRPGSPRRFAR